MERILVPLDGSPLSEAVLPVAEALARAHDAEVVLLQVLPTAPPVGLPEEAARARELEEGVRQAEAYLTELADKARARGAARVRWTARSTERSPAAAIVEAATESGADVIAMATHGRGGLGRLLLGSVAESVVRHARVPVLLVRGEPAWQAGVPTRVLVPLDGSPVSEEILPLVQRLAGPLDLEIVLLHVVEPVPAAAMAEMSPQAEQVLGLREPEAEAYLERTAAALQAKGLRVARAPSGRARSWTSSRATPKRPAPGSSP